MDAETKKITVNLLIKAITDGDEPSLAQIRLVNGFVDAICEAIAQSSCYDDIAAHETRHHRGVE